MSVRGVRVYRRTDPQKSLSYLIEKNGIEGGLLFQNNVVLALDSDAWDVERRNYTKIIDAYGITGVLRLSAVESVLVVVTGVLSVGQLYGIDILKITNCEFVPLKTIGNLEYVDSRISDLQRLFASGMFYFSANSDYDLTCCAQRRVSKGGSDVRFFWNRSMHFVFDRFGIDSSKWLLKCMAGSVLVRTVYVGHRTGRVALISRLSCERVGTRFNVRGANYLGHVANFVETEQLIIFDEKEVSLIQVRGSIPLFWEQPGVQVGSHRVKLRAFDASAPAYHRHMSKLLTTYGGATVVTLLGRKEGERVLSEAFKTQHKLTKMSTVIEFIEFDYHSQMRSSKESINILKKKLVPVMNNYGFFSKEGTQVLRSQSGVIRTNCLDCLDRTNSVQTMLGLHAVAELVSALKLDAGKVNVEQRIEEILKDLWVKNGDQCSTIYAGTGALDGKSKLKDASRSIARTIQNNLMDSSKQDAFDLLLAGTSFDQKLFDQVSNLLPRSVIQEYADATSQIVERRSEITAPSPLKIFVGTWNVNGGKNINNVAFRNESNLSHWLFPSAQLLVLDDLDHLPDIVAIGVEELVDLNASNMVKASTTNQRLWAESIRKTLNEKGSYILIASEQLVGVCLFLYVRPGVTPSMKDFAVCSVKTGMGGATGNKGSVAMRLVVNSTSICFVCSHFAAGQKEVLDRNEDFATAVKRIRFPQGRDIDTHDVIFWFGDFNYRINLGGDEVKRAVANGQLDQLVPNDQLTQQKAQGLTFIDYEEGSICFAPTYKYDTFSDDYDTSEKCRVPAWTDRILWKEQRNDRDTRLIRYDRAELKTSDHRPVYANFVVNTYKVDQTKCAALVEDVISCMGPPDGTIICSVEGHNRFPQQVFPVLVEKLREINAAILASKYDSGELWVVLESGELALAALSMDGLCVPSGGYLSVRLKSPLWNDKISIPEELTESDSYTSQNEIVESMGRDFEFEDDDEMSSLSLTSSSFATAPDRPRPPSSRSDILLDNATAYKIPNCSQNENSMLSSSYNNNFLSRCASDVAVVPHPFSSSWSSPNLAAIQQKSNPFNAWEQSENYVVPPLPPSRQSSVHDRTSPGDAPPIPVRQAPPPPPPRPQIPVIPPRPKGW